jgi:hypothetical protein
MVNGASNSSELVTYDGPTSRIIRARDVVLIPRNGTSELGVHPVRDEHQLANGVHVGPFDRHEAHLIANACVPRCHNFVHEDLKTALYAFWTEIPADQLRRPLTGTKTTQFPRLLSSQD